MSKKSRSRRDDDDEVFRDVKQNRRDKRSSRRAIKNTLQTGYQVLDDELNYEEYDTDGLEEFEEQ